MALSDGRSPSGGEFVNVAVTVIVGGALAWLTGGTSLVIPTIIAAVAGGTGVIAGNQGRPSIGVSGKF